MPSYTRSGVRRTGDDYQDVVGAEILIEELEHPGRYSWISFETPGVGALDDVVACRADGSMIYRQVKFAAHPETDEGAVTWDYLLVPAKKGAKCFLEKWIAGFKKAAQLGPMSEASLVTNRPVGPDFGASLVGTRVDFEKVPKSQRETILAFDKVTEVEVREFFGRFDFLLDRPSLETASESCETRLLKLGVDRRAWLELLQKIREWVNHKDRPVPDGKIRLGDIRRAALWRIPRDMSQDFVVPGHYVLPDPELDSRVQLAVSARSCAVVTGAPGTGKSTYLSRLVGESRVAGQAAIRHHYHLSLADRTVDRFSWQRVADSLMAQLQSLYGESLGGVASTNPGPEDLASWIEASGRWFHSEGKTLTVVIDGLDHVWREQGSVEALSLLLDHLLPAPTGVSIILGTQPVEASLLPKSLLRHAPRRDWVEVPMLGYRAVCEWLLLTPLLSLGEAGDPDAEQAAAGLAEAILDKSAGHPLYLEYVSRSLSGVQQPAPEHVEALPSCPDGNITAYYDELWGALTQSGQLVLHLVSCTPFEWSPSGIVDCLASSPLEISQVLAGIRRVEHLLSEEHARLSIFHESLRAYVMGLDEYAACANHLIASVRKWMDESASDEVRWAWCWIIDEMLGNAGPLIDGATHDWAVEAISRGRSADQIKFLLGRAQVAALRDWNLLRTVECSILIHYVGELDTGHGETAAQILRCVSRYSTSHDYDWGSARELEAVDEGRLLLACEEQRSGEFSPLAGLAREEFKRRFERDRDVYSRGPTEELVKLSLRLAILDADAPTQRIVDYLKEWRPLGSFLELHVAVILCPPCSRGTSLFANFRTWQR